MSLHRSSRGGGTGFSRQFHFWCTDREDAEHTYNGLIRSFEWFGGVPAEVLVLDAREIQEVLLRSS